MAFYSVSTGDTATAAANTEVLLTVAANKIARHGLKQIHASYSGAPTNGVLTIEEGSGNVVRRYPFGTATEKTIDFPGDGLILDKNTALVCRLSAGGAGIIGTINITRTVG